MKKCNVKKAKRVLTRGSEFGNIQKLCHGHGGRRAGKKHGKIQDRALKKDPKKDKKVLDKQTLVPYNKKARRKERSESETLESAHIENFIV